MSDEPTYTLSEARAKIARDECDAHGHDLSVTQVRGFGTCFPVSVLCDRCHEHWSVPADAKGRDMTTPVGV